MLALVSSTRYQLDWEHLINLYCVISAVGLWIFLLAGAALLAVAARVEAVRAGLSQEVRQAEQAGSSRAAAVAGAQQMLAQATMIEESPAGLLLLPGVVASAGGPQHGVSGVVY